MQSSNDTSESPLTPATPAVAPDAPPASPFAAGVAATAPTPAAQPSPEAQRLAGLEGLVRELGVELLAERRRERRWRYGWRFALLGLVLASFWVLNSPGLVHGTAPSTPHTALVEVRGEIAPDSEASADLLVGALRQAFEDEGAQAVVLRINSPGGSPVQAGIVYDEIRRLKALHNKKVFAVVEEICASGAYYIAASADEIYVDKASIVGSIGVLMDGFGFSGLMSKLGVERRLLTAGENKAMLDPFSPPNAKQDAYAKAMLDQIHRQFIAVVKEGRGERLKEQPDTFSGLFWNGEEAVKLGLADHFGNLDFVAREVVKAEDVIDYTPQDNVAERLAKRFGAAVGQGAVKALRQPSSIH